MKTRTATVSVLLTAAITASLPGCATGGVQAQPVGTCTDCPPAATATPTPTTPDPAAQERRDRQDAETAWRAFNALTFNVASLPAEQVEPALTAVAVDPVLSRLRAANTKLRSQHQTGYGQNLHYISWPEPINGKDVAVLRDCQDGTQVGFLDAKTGYKLTVGTSNSPARGTLNRTPQGWRVANAESLDEAVTCTPSGEWQES